MSPLMDAKARVWRCWGIASGLYFKGLQLQGRGGCWTREPGARHHHQPAHKEESRTLRSRGMNADPEGFKHPVCRNLFRLTKSRLLSLDRVRASSLHFAGDSQLQK